ncbi:phage tail sheath C-terminal domain-containing protein [Aquitalea pelogenes]|uniref:phage tail sheath C-terminal domain-containing protein n=1 Tax=Aquitalea pelogenes TaxID=1293573 RepID=UPI003B8453D8
MKRCWTSPPSARWTMCAAPAASAPPALPRDKLSERTPDKVRSEILDVLYKLEELEILEAVDANKDGVLVERDLQNVGWLCVRIPADVVNGLHVIAGRIDLLL